MARPLALRRRSAASRKAASAGSRESRPSELTRRSRPSASARSREQKELSHMSLPVEGPFPGLKLVDTDSHYSEPWDLWSSRAPKKYQDVVPQVRPDSK